jgi:DDE superfamily endonuclease
MSRYGKYSEKTYRRQYGKSVEFIKFHAETIKTAIEENREQISAIDCSFIGKSGKKTWGIDWFYNGSAGRAEKGLEISVIAVVDVKAHQGYTLSVQQTAARTEPQQIDKSTLIVEEKKKKKGRHKSSPTEPVVSERVQGYLNQLKIARQHLPAGVKYLAADSFYSKKFFVDGVRELGLHLVSKLRIDANLRYLYTGDQKPRGARRKYGDKVDVNDLSKLDFIAQVNPDVQLYSQVVWHVSLGRKIRIVLLVNHHNPDRPSVALLFSTDTELDPQKTYLYYKMRFQIEFIFRDAKQFTGLCDCQSRQEQSLDFHFNASLAALNLAKLEQQQAVDFDVSSTQPVSFSMATYQRQSLNHHLLERFISMLDLDQTLIKSHPNYPTLLHYGSLTS